MKDRGFIHCFGKALCVAVLLPVLFSCGLLINRKSPVYFAGPAVVGDYKPLGQVKEVRYPDSHPGPSLRRMIVYLPAEYDAAGEKRYPVVYLLHGARGYETSWIRKGDVYHLTDSLISHRLAEPYILVMPNVNQYDDDGDFDHSRYKDALESVLEVDGSVESGFIHDVVDCIDRNFRTLPDKAHRAIAGLSIGGLKSIYISANFPEAFDYVGAFSPMTWTFFKSSPERDFYNGLDDKLAVQFGDNPPKGYYLMSGKTDYIHFAAEDFHKKLDKKGYPHQYFLSEGSHEWYNWKDYYVLMMQLVFKDGSIDKNDTRR